MNLGRDRLIHPLTYPQSDVYYTLMSKTNSKMMAIDPRTGLHLREATPEETSAWLAQPVRHAAFRKTIRVSDVLVDQYNGPGVWFGGAGF